MLPPRPPFSFLIGTRAISPPSSHEPKSLSSGTRPASTGGSQLGSLSFQMTINPNSKRRRQCSIQGSGNDKEEGGLWNRWEFLVCMKAAPITDRKAERPKNLTRVLFPGISRAQNSHSAPPPLAAQVPRSHSRATDQSSEFRTPALDRGNSSFFLSLSSLSSPTLLSIN